MNFPFIPKNRKKPTPSIRIPPGTRRQNTPVQWQAEERHAGKHQLTVLWNAEAGRRRAVASYLAPPAAHARPARRRRAAPSSCQPALQIWPPTVLLLDPAELCCLHLLFLLLLLRASRHRTDRWLKSNTNISKIWQCLAVPVFYYLNEVSLLDFQFFIFFIIKKIPEKRKFLHLIINRNNVYFTNC